MSPSGFPSQIFNDSMLNFETVKYFDGTAHEEATYDRALMSYQDAALRTQYSLAALNFGQNLIFSAGFSASLLLVANEAMAGRMTVGDVVMVRTAVLQCCSHCAASLSQRTLASARPLAQTPSLSLALSLTLAQPSA